MKIACGFLLGLENLWIFCLAVMETIRMGSRGAIVSSAVQQAAF